MSDNLELYSTRREVRRKRPVVRALRKEIHAEQEGACVYCCKATVLPEDNPPAGTPVATLEHRTPLCRGGTNERDNLAVACTNCNHAKGDLTEAEFLANGMRSRPPGMTRALVHDATKRRRSAMKHPPPLEHRKSLTSILLEMELDIQRVVVTLGAERFMGGYRRARNDAKSFNNLMEIMELHIRREVKRVANARYPQIWGRDRLPKARFDKSRAFTAPLADIWPAAAVQ